MGTDQMTQAEIIELMKSSRNHQEWNQNSHKVMDQNAGQLPHWWYDELIASGVKSEAMSRGNND